jgi:16S rRNA (adenine(1408)-N(1))-methyltransferase
VRNLLCIAEPTEIVADDLGGIANRVSVILPWGTLLRGIALPEISLLGHVRRLCVPDAPVEIVLSYDDRWDGGQQGRFGFAPIHESHVRGALAESYERAGFRLTSIETISQSDLRRYETTWATRLAFSRPREVWRLRLSAGSNPL